MKERPILFSGEMVRAILAGKKTQTRRLLNPQPNVRTVTLHHTTDRRDGRWEFTARDSRGRVVYAFPVDRHSLRAEIACPYGAVGGRLWVKETHAFFSIDAFKYLEGPLESLGLRAYGGKPLSPGCDLRWGTGDAMVHYAAHHPASVKELSASSGFSTYRSTTPDKWRPSILMPRWASRITLDVADIRIERLHDITEEDAKAEGAAWRIAPGGDLAGAFEGLGGDIGYRNHFADLWRKINGAESWDANPYVWVVEFLPFNAAQARAA